MVTIECAHCGKIFSLHESRLKEHNYCDKICRGAAKRITKPCAACGKPVTRLKCAMVKELCCDRTCASVYLSRKMTAMNEELNPDRMTVETRTKIREAHLDSGEGVFYEKTFGVHTHRTVAEMMLGRQLKPGEVVHHINEDIRDNRPENLMVFPSQAEHAKWHKEAEKLLR